MTKTITLNPETVEAYRELMTNPQKHGLEFRPLEKCFKVSTQPRACHKLFKDYLQESPATPKLMFYLVMVKIYGQPPVKDEGDLGYLLKFKPNEKEKTHSSQR